MTCIIGLKHKSKVFMAADSMVSYGGQAIASAEGKLFMREGVVVGTAGGVRAAQVMRHLYDWPKLKDGVDLDGWLFGEFVPAFQRLLQEQGQLRSSNGVTTMGSTFLIGVRGRLFELDQYFDVVEPAGDYYSIGSGSEIAHGVMYATSTKRMNPRARLGLALQAASFHMDSVRPPFQIASV